jgi:P-type Cu2+ transporter
MIQDFKKRFFVSLILTIFILLLSPMIRDLLPFGYHLVFPGDLYLLFTLSTLVYLYGGSPFIKGLFKELQAKTLGMMTLIGLAITVSYVYSSFVIFGLSGIFSFGNLPLLLISCFLDIGLR